MNKINSNRDYRQALIDIEQRIQSAQMRTVLAANAELFGLHCGIGRKANWAGYISVSGK